MNIIQVANSLANSPFPVSGFVTEPLPQGVRLEDWARRHASEWAAGDIFVIDASFSLCPGNEDLFDGIRLLKILRLLGYRQHCIVYSFFPEHFFLKNPFNSILLSQGTTFVRLPNVINESLCEQRIPDICEDSVLTFFRSEAIELMGTERHSLANWWGMIRIFEILCYCGFIGDIIPDEIMDMLSRDSSYEGMLMNYVRFRGCIPELAIEEKVQNSIKKNIQSLWKRNLKVVYVDDQAGDGWAYLLQILFYGKTNPERFFVPKLNRTGNDLVALSDEILAHNPDLIILDMRLEPDDEKNRVSDLSGMRLLTRMTSKLRNVCPILVFTASDKRELGEKALESGADCIWTKEGIDESESFSNEEFRTFSLDRFHALTKRIRVLTGPEYSLLYDSLRRIKQLETSAEKYWWQKQKWHQEDNKSRIPVDKTLILNNLKEIFIMHKQLLQSALPEVHNVIYEILSIKLCRLIELFHPLGYDSEGHDIPLSRVVYDDWPQWSRQYAYAMYIVHERNDLFHLSSLKVGHIIPMQRYENLLNTFWFYLSADTSKEHKVNTFLGRLIRQHSKEGKPVFLIESDDNSCFIPLKFSETCLSILDGKDTAKDVEVVISQPSPCFMLTDVFLPSPSADAGSYWTAAFRVTRSSAKGIDISISKIGIRKGTSFLLPKDFQILNPGDIIHFHVSFLDNGEKRFCMLRHIHREAPSVMEYTYWRGTITKTKQFDGKTFAFLKDLIPPFNAYFRVSHAFLPILEHTEERIGFHMNWNQDWTVEEIRRAKI